MYGFVLLLITKEVIQLKTIIMIFTELPGRDRCKIPGERKTYVHLAYIQFRLCAHVNAKSTNIFHECSQCNKNHVKIM